MLRILLVLTVIGLLLSGYILGDDSTAKSMSLDDIVVSRIIDDFSLDPEYTEVTIARLDIKQRDASGCDIELYPLTSGEPKGRVPFRIEMYRAGEKIATGSVSLNIRVFKDLLVPVRKIDRHELLTQDLFTVKRFDVTSLTERMFTDPEEIAGYRAKQNLMPDRYITPNRVERVPDVENGGPITIVGNSDFLEIQARGVALQQGYIGESIKVKNMASQKILTGKITSPGVVEVAI